MGSFLVPDSTWWPMTTSSLTSSICSMSHSSWHGEDLFFLFVSWSIFPFFHIFSLFSSLTAATGIRDNWPHKLYLGEQRWSLTMPSSPTHPPRDIRVDPLFLSTRVLRSIQPPHTHYHYELAETQFWHLSNSPSRLDRNAKKIMSSKAITQEDHESRNWDDLMDLRFCTHIGPIQIF